MKKILVLAAILALVFASCTSDSGGDTPSGEKPGSVDFDRGAMLANWADHIIIPSYADFSKEITGLSASFATFKADASETNLVALRESWLKAYKAWQHVDMFEIGPAEMVGLRLNMNTYPTATDKIKTNVESGNYDLALPSNRMAKGFPALDYLINGLGETDAEILKKLDTSSAEEAYLPYMEAVIMDMQQLADHVLSDWKQTYRDTFVANNGSSSTASVDQFVNDYIFYYEKFLRAGKMGIPLGVFSGSVRPGNLEAYYQGDVSKMLFLEGLNSFQDFFNGKHFSANQKGPSLASYLDALNKVKSGSDLNKIINEQLDEARTKVSALESFRDEIENNDPPVAMNKAYDEVQRVVPLLKVDMVSAMNISIAYVDNDGD